MATVFKYLISACIFAGMIGHSAASDPAPQGFLEGHLKIVSLKEVELADGSVPPKATAGNYADCPLIILSQDAKKEITRVTADENGNYRVALSPGDYILDVQGRKPKGHLRAKPQPFTVASNQTVRVDMDIDTGIR